MGSRFGTGGTGLLEYQNGSRREDGNVLRRSLMMRAAHGRESLGRQDRGVYVTLPHLIDNKGCPGGRAGRLLGTRARRADGQTPPHGLRPGEGTLQRSVTTSIEGSAARTPAKEKVTNRMRHLLGDTEGLPMGAKVRSARVFERAGIKPLLGRLVAKGGSLRLSDLWPNVNDDDREGEDRDQETPGPRGGRGASGSVRLGSGGPVAAAVAGLRRAAEVVGVGADACVDEAEQEDEQGPRTSAGELRGVRLRPRKARNDSRLPHARTLPDGFRVPPRDRRRIPPSVHGTAFDRARLPLVLESPEW